MPETVKLHALISTLDIGEWSVSRSGCFYLRGNNSCYQLEAERATDMWWWVLPPPAGTRSQWLTDWIILVRSWWSAKKLLRVGTLPNCIREVPGSNLGRDTDYPEGFSRLSSALQVNAAMVTRVMLSSTSFPICHSLIIVPFDAIGLYRQWKKTKLRGRSPQANYTDRSTAACRLS
jgi:hypothetical protein